VTLVSSIILDAFRESNMLPLGKAPTDAQSTEALRLYNQILKSTYGGVAGEPLRDWALGTFDQHPEPPFVDEAVDETTTHYPPINARLVVLNLAPATVYLTDRPQDGARYGLADPFSRLADFPVTLDANGRTIEGAPTVIVSENGLFREWIYRADLAAWLRVDGVEPTTENPFPADFDIMFTILLAMRLNPRYGRSIDDQSTAMLRQNKREFIARYLQSSPLDIDDSISWPFLSRQSYGTGREFTTTDAFNHGRVR
jgi:hypothetical protein